MWNSLSGLFRPWMKLLQTFWLYAKMFTSVALGFALFGRRSQIKRLVRGERTLEGARRVAVFVHYDLKGFVADYVVYYMQELVRTGFEVVFVSNAPKLPDSEIARVLPYCALVAHRANRGHDFGAYRDGIALVNLDSIDQLLISNDSVYGPLYDLSETFEKCTPDVAMWGITDSWEMRYHVQSYFLVFNKLAIDHPKFRKFWSNMILVRNRDWVIRQYELGLTKTCIEAGLLCKAVFPFRDTAQVVINAVLKGQILESKTLPQHHVNYVRHIFSSLESGVPLNPTHFLWDYLIETLRCPFIKRDLISANKLNVPYVNQWEMVLKRCSDYDTNLIINHLKVVSRNRAI